MACTSDVRGCGNTGLCFYLLFLMPDLGWIKEIMLLPATIWSTFEEIVLVWGASRM